MNRNSGFTLVELVVTMMIVAVLMAVAVPSFRYVTTANRISSEINGLVGDMQFARGEAIKEGQTVTVCPSNDNATCSPGTEIWAGGWIVFADANGNQTVDGNEPVLRVQTAFTSTDTFLADNPVAVTFNREGFAIGLVPIAPVTIKLHDVNNTQAFTRCLAINAVGQLTMEAALTGNCT